MSESINLPFRVSPVVKELGRTRLEVNVKVKANYSSVTGAGRRRRRRRRRPSVEAAARPIRPSVAPLADGVVCAARASAGSVSAAAAAAASRWSWRCEECAFCLRRKMDGVAVGTAAALPAPHDGQRTRASFAAALYQGPRDSENTVFFLLLSW